MKCFSRSSLTLGVVAVAAVMQPYRPMRFVGGSMSPTYQSGEFALTKPVDRLLKRGDIVLVDSPAGTIVKRVALVEGDSYKQIGLAGRWQDITGAVQPLKMTRHMRIKTVPPGTVYLLGDNLTTSIDSRSFGPVPVEQVKRLLVAPRAPSPNSVVYRIAMATAARNG